MKETNSNNEEEQNFILQNKVVADKNKKNKTATDIYISAMFHNSLQDKFETKWEDVEYKHTTVQLKENKQVDCFFIPTKISRFEDDKQMIPLIKAINKIDINKPVIFPGLYTNIKCPKDTKGKLKVALLNRQLLLELKKKTKKPITVSKGLTDLINKIPTLEAQVKDKEQKERKEKEMNQTFTVFNKYLSNDPKEKQNKLRTKALMRKYHGKEYVNPNKLNVITSSNTTLDGKTLQTVYEAYKTNTDLKKEYQKNKIDKQDYLTFISSILKNVSSLSNGKITKECALKGKTPVDAFVENVIDIDNVKQSLDNLKTLAKLTQTDLTAGG